MPTTKVSPTNSLNSSWEFSLRNRRVFFGLLVFLTAGAAIGVMSRILLSGGLTLVEAGMLFCFSMTIPWITIGFWNAVIGLFLSLGSRDPIAATCPFVARTNDAAPISTRTAIVMPVYNEAPGAVFDRIDRTLASLEDTGQAGHFEFFLLSDTQIPEIADEEAQRFAALAAGNHRGVRLHYRRRENNIAQKTGNLRDFCERWGANFDFMVVLDADSVMTGDVLLRMVRTMQSNERMGILQTLVVGLPAQSGFARLFQFGMRQGMRTYTLGSVWWQGEDGPYWGHNAILRVKPFMEDCELPVLPGKPPLGGRVLSHDQVEAALMRKAGYEVNVLPLECGSFEENPPTILDFIQRDLRWCQGNMQYTKLLNHPGLLPIGRIQLVLAILMYLGSPFWLTFLVLGLGQAVAAGLGADPSNAMPLIDTFWGQVDSSFGLLFFFAMMGMTFTPKILGVLEVALQQSKRRAYGGGGRLFVSALAEFIFSVAIAPIISMAHTIFIIGLFFGRRIVWDAQDREGAVIGFGKGFQAFWPQTLFGVTGLTALSLAAPGVLPYAAPVLVPLTLAVPIAHLTSRKDFGRALAAIRLCPMPEELSQRVRIVFRRPPQPLPGRGVEGVRVISDRAAAVPRRVVNKQKQASSGTWT